MIKPFAGVGRAFDSTFGRYISSRRAHTRGRPAVWLVSAVCPLEGTHKGCPYGFAAQGGIPRGGHPQGVPLRFRCSRRFAWKRAPTRGAPTVSLLKAVFPGEGTHKGCPYGLASQGGTPGRGHPQGVPLRFGFSWRYSQGRAPTRGAPTGWLLKAVCPGEGTHKGGPYGFAAQGGLPGGGHPQGGPLRVGCSRGYAQGRAPTRGAPTGWLLKRVCPGEGTHKGGPYGLASQGGLPRGGHPRGVPLRVGCSRGYAQGRAPTRGAPTVWLLKAVYPGEGTHKGRPYGTGWGGILLARHVAGEE